MSSNRRITGIIVIIIGLILLVESTGVLEIGNIWNYIPSLFVLLGLWTLIRSKFQNITGPVIVIVIAGTIQLMTLDQIPDRIIDQWWPLILVIIGLTILFGRSRDYKKEDSDQKIDTISIFSERNIKSVTNNFRGGSILAIFGGAEIDLRDSSIDDPPATITTTVMFGGVDIIASGDWNIKMDAFPIFGGAEDKRSRITESQNDETVDLKITGFAAFGGIDIKN